MTINLNEIVSYSWTQLHEIEVELGIELHAIKKQISESDEMVKELYNELQEQIKKDPAFKELSPEDKGHYYTHVFEREEYIMQDLQLKQSYSALLGLYAFIERCFWDLCHKIQIDFDSKVKLKDLNGHNILQKYWNYLNKVIEVETKDLEQFFEPLKLHQIVRNSVAHRGGLISEDNYSKHIKEKHGLKGWNHGADMKKLSFDKDQNLHLLTCTENLFNGLLDMVDAKMSNSKS